MARQREKRKDEEQRIGTVTMVTVVVLMYGKGTIRSNIPDCNGLDAISTSLCTVVKQKTQIKLIITNWPRSWIHSPVH